MVLGRHRKIDGVWVKAVPDPDDQGAQRLRKIIAQVVEDYDKAEKEG